MKKYFFSLMVVMCGWLLPFSAALAQGATATQSTAQTATSILGISDKDLRSGNVNMDSIPEVLRVVIEFIIGISGTISVFMLIFFAVKMQLNSGITGDASGVENARKGMIAALIGFLISVSAWFVMARVIDFLYVTQ